MAAAERLDGFKEVHKGLRNALFTLSLQAGATDAGKPEEVEELIRKSGEVFHFLEHHALNEDRFLVPDMEAKSMIEAARMLEDHVRFESEVKTLRKLSTLLADSPAQVHSFYLALNQFISGYLLHIHDEETEILAALHARFTDAELSDFPQKSVAATSPKDQSMMLSYMFPAMNGGELKGFFGRLRGKVPAEVMNHLEGIAARVLGDRVKSIH